ncbi:hypothetical protein L596_030783 [Steinernema carpocapsae]|uniref:Chondroitin proteoglycan 4 domain-containing protein n=1 Tax=Steinernema carpocapsae TaxID=34508 RepID=A0A4U5LNR8_STECR|nr:hypothetical protein L596_030783 [Steinernema carpocapsae]
MFQHLSLLYFLTLLILCCTAYKIRLPTQYIQEHPCISSCVANFSSYEYPTNILEGDDYATYLVNLRDICPVLNDAHDCVSECDDSSFNPFSKRLYLAMCKQERLEALEPYLPCMKMQTETIKEECVEVCGSMDEIVTQISNLTYQNELKHDAHLEHKISLFEHYQCGRVQCFVQCNKSLFSKLCPLVNGETVGSFLKHFILDTLQASVDDMRASHTKDSGPLLPNCTFIYKPDTLFNDAPRTFSCLYIFVFGLVAVMLNL